MAINFDPAALTDLTVKGGMGSDTFTVTDTLSGSSQRLTLSTGSGDDKGFVQASTGPLTVSSTGGADVVTIGNAGSLQGIKGTVLVQNPPSFTDLIIDGSADTTPVNATMAIVTISGVQQGRITGLTPPSAEIDYVAGDLNSLEVKAGSAGGTVTNTMSLPGSLHTTTLDLGAGGYTVNVQGTAGALIINGGSGNDTVKVGSTASTLDTIQGAVTVNGQDGFDTLTINDQGSTTPHVYTQTASTFSRDGAATITFSGIESLQPNKGAVQAPCARLRGRG